MYRPNTRARSNNSTGLTFGKAYPPHEFFSNRAVFSDAVGGALPTSAVVTGTNSAIVTVPQGSVTGPFYLQLAQNNLPPVQSNAVQFQRLARLRIRAAQNDVGAGESINSNMPCSEIPLREPSPSQPIRDHSKDLLILHQLPSTLTHLSTSLGAFLGRSLAIPRF